MIATCIAVIRSMRPPSAGGDEGHATKALGLIGVSWATLAVSACLALPIVAEAKHPPWKGSLANAYRQTYVVCRLFGPVKVRREYGIKETSAVMVALRYSQEAWRAKWQQAGFEGCLDGFHHKRPQVKGTWP